MAHGADGFLLFPTKRNAQALDAWERLHSHVYYEFFFVRNAPLTLVTERGQESFTNSVVIVPPQYKHVSCCEGNDGYCIAVTASNVGSMREQGLLDYVKKHAFTVLPLNDELVYCLQKLSAEDVFSRFGKAKSNAYMQLLFLEIASLLHAKDTQTGGETVNAKYRYIEKIDRFMGDNYNKPTATIATLAKELYLSERQVSRILKKEYGCTFVELVRERKMTVAGVLLKNTSLPVSTLIKKLGFETENYFYRTFKAYYGVTPLRYRLAQTSKK